jgi:hypothetical protein
MLNALSAVISGPIHLVVSWPILGGYLIKERGDVMPYKNPEMRRKVAREGMRKIRLRDNLMMFATEIMGRPCNEETYNEVVREVEEDFRLRKEEQEGLTLTPEEGSKLGA